MSGNCIKLEGLFEGDKLVSALPIPAYVTWFDGNRCEMGGIGGVLSDPEERRTGGVKRLMKHALEQMRASGQILSHLYPFETPFYRKYGYEHVGSMTKWTIPLECMKQVEFSGVERFGGTKGNPRLCRGNKKALAEKKVIKKNPSVEQKWFADHTSTIERDPN